MIEISGLALVLVRATIIVIMGLVTYILIPWLRTTKNKWYVDIAVKAAEFAYKSVVKAGPAKKNYVIEWLQKRGIYIDEKDLDILIDSILLELPKGGEEDDIN